jgi:glycosyltransferase involved in cell wall biosynthesis
MLARSRWDDSDVAVTCSYPYTHWALRARHLGRPGPAHVFVTHSGDWPAYQPGREGRFFRCDGLVCINRPYFERNRDRWFCALIPNGVDPARFHPGPGDRAAIGLPEGRPVVLMACALVEGKMVLEGMRAVAGIEDAFLVVAGHGPLAEEVDRLAGELLPGRFLRRTFPHDQMPSVYCSADVLLHPGFPESFGNVYIEALACGLPVVANDNASTRWIFDGQGFLTDTTSQNALRDAIRQALRSPAGHAAARAAFAADRYAWRSVAPQYRGFLEEVVRRRR